MLSASLTPLISELVRPAALATACAFANDLSTLYLIPNPKKRPYFRYAIECYLRLSLLEHKEVYVTSPHCEGLAIWIHSNATSLPSLTNILRAGWPWQPLRCGLTFFLRDSRMNQYYEKLRREIAPKPHLYLALLSVAPEFQGQGFASKLIRPMLARLDAKRLPAYLETQNLRNVAMYERYGFQLVREGVFPSTDLKMYIMVRHSAILPSTNNPRPEN